MKNYQSPEIQFQDMQLKEEIANTCWGGHSGRLTWFYDTKGEGYVSFQISGGSCTLTPETLSNVTFYKDQNASGTPGTDKFEELYAALRRSGGESGNPFKGEGVDFPVTPDPSWS